MLYAKPLEWVQRNRTRRNRTLDAQTVVQRLLDTVNTAGVEQTARMAKVLAGVVDHLFREHCRLAGIQGGALIVHVDHPALVAFMRVQWSRRLCSVLQGQGGRCTARKVTFRPGQEGVPIPENG
ncbi:MAG: DUF721 domain-containing protein [Planctomycetes bacterium]|nr:DUF721 domain-containing protein [Planctomycetota bacterium]